MKWTMIRETERARLLAMFKQNEMRFLESLMARDPPLSDELIDAEMKSIESIDQERIEIILDQLLGDENPPQLAPQSLDRPKSGDWNSPA